MLAKKEVMAEKPNKEYVDNLLGFLWYMGVENALLLSTGKNQAVLVKHSSGLVSKLTGYTQDAQYAILVIFVHINENLSLFQHLLYNTIGATAYAW